MAHGFVYLTAVVDVASRRVLAHKVPVTLEACHAREMLELALVRWGLPDIFNTDQGRQFTTEEFSQAVLSRGCPLASCTRSRCAASIGLGKKTRIV